MVFSCCFFSFTDGDEATVLQRLKRDYQNDDPKAYLDQVISYWIHRIPTLIDIAVAQSEKDLTLTVAKRVTQVSFGFPPNCSLLLVKNVCRL